MKIISFREANIFWQKEETSAVERKEKRKLNQVRPDQPLDSARDLATSKPVIQDLNISIETGDLVGVVGPVGSGKTSFLLALLG